MQLSDFLLAQDIFENGDVHIFQGHEVTVLKNISNMLLLCRCYSKPNYVRTIAPDDKFCILSKDINDYTPEIVSICKKFKMEAFD